MMNLNGGVRRALIASAMCGVIVACANDPSATGVGDLDVVEPSIAEDGTFRVAIDAEASAIVNVRSRAFASMDELLRFAVDVMGGEPVYDEAGQLVGARGAGVISGDVRFRDEETGEIFEADDLAQAFLGGAEGVVSVGGERLEIGEARVAAHQLDAELGVVSAALSGDSVGCVGGDCISGHSWRTNYLVYRSIGSETRQSSGGESPYTYSCCRGGGTLTGGRCRYVTEWEPADPENGQYRPIPIAYGYRPADTCTGTATRNTLTLGITVINESGWATAFTPITETNTREISRSEWGVGWGVSFLGIDDARGVCGFHSGSRGSTTRTRAGSATDAQCDPPIPTFAVAR